jgi:lipoate-protein ligase A
MLIIYRRETNPFFNIAAEEYLLKNFREDIFTIWIDEPSVVVGKHQNTLAEINYPYIRQENIPVIRRLTGGGTVYHDHGNLNYSLITTGEPGKLVDYRKYTLPVIQFLASLGLKAEFQGKSNLVVNGKKFSGNSAHVYRNRVVHHGTILFSTDLYRLHQALHREKNIYRDKAVQSVRADVTNLKEHLPEIRSIDQFAGEFQDFFMNNLPGTSIYTLEPDDLAEIYKLADTKYRSWEWNYGYSPDYEVSNSFHMIGQMWNVELKVSKGIITGFRLWNEGETFAADLGELLAGTPHREDSIKRKADNINFAVDPTILIQNIF